MASIVALDISKGKSYVVIYTEHQCLWEKEIVHNKRGFELLLNQILSLPHRPDIVFEATGIYSKPIETFCRNNGFHFCRLNPQEAKKQLQVGTLRSWKTDTNDAHRLALTHWVNQRPTTIVEPDMYKEIKDYKRFYNEMEEQINRLRMHLHNALQLTFPELEYFFSSRVTSYALTLIQLYPHPDRVLHSSRTKIKNTIKHSTKKKISENRARKKASEIMEYARISYPSVDRDSIQSEKARYYASKLQDLFEEKETIKEAMIQKAKELDEFELYVSIPGIGENTAAQLIGELGDLTRFSTSKQLNAYVGIDIRRYQSGTYAGRDHINKRGNAHARRLLYLIILNMIRAQNSAPSHIIDYYYKLKTTTPSKPHKVAVIACINKLLKCIHAMVRKHTLYNYSITVS